ncbi:hypothetical protein GCM10011324_05550 [Allosediminivita pacifica]|nr:hypothetical protein GCM10011324_05550 [Allosediminivita pacifica]
MLRIVQFELKEPQIGELPAKSVRDVVRDGWGETGSSHRGSHRKETDAAWPGVLPDGAEKRAGPLRPTFSGDFGRRGARPERGQDDRVNNAPLVLNVFAQLHLFAALAAVRAFQILREFRKRMKVLL